MRNKITVVAAVLAAVSLWPVVMRGQIRAGAVGMVNVKNYGARGDTRMVKDAVLTSSSSTVTSATAAFTSSDVGKIIYGVETSTGLLRLPRGTVSAVNSSTSITVSTTATGNYTGIWLVFGTDDADGIRSAVTAARAMEPMGTVYLPSGGYLTTKALFNTSHPSGGGGTSRLGLGVTGDGSQSTVIFLDPTFDFSTTSTNTGAIAYHTTGGNVTGTKLSGFMVEGAFYSFSGSSYYGISLGGAKGEILDVRVSNVRGFASAVLVSSSEALVTRLYVEQASGTGVTANAPMTCVHCYAGNSGGFSWLGSNIDIDAYTGTPLVFVDSLIDESTSGSLSLSSTDAVMVATTAYGPASAYAVTVDGSSSLRAIGSRIVPYTTSGNRSGMTVASGGRVWLSDTVIDKAGSGTAINNSGTIYDSGGNEFNSNAPVGNALLGLRMPGGAVGAPSYSFSGDTNTGMYSSAADTIDYAIGGVKRFTMSGSSLATDGVPVIANNGYILTNSDYFMRTATGCMNVGASDRKFFCAHAPTIASGFGTTPAIAGVASAFTVTVGSGGVATTGTVNFAVTFNVAPRCVAQNQTTDLAVRATPTTTQVVLTSPSAFTAADKIDVLCFGGS